jgi:7-carboxy-7-deazaguanine synthase
MRIAEIFHSIQGEGILAGMPSVFVRTSGCNLRCDWCDTPYASWHPEGDEMTVEEVLRVVADHSSRHVVVTGGEPMVAKGIEDLLSGIAGSGLHATVETAGTVMPPTAPIGLASVSPKLSNSTPTEAKAGAGWVERHEATRCRPDVLRAWCELPEYQLKFVVSAPSDVDEIERVLESTGLEIPAERVLLMPEGTDSETLHGRQDFVVEACKGRGYRFSPRLHIDLFGNRRGT